MYHSSDKQPLCSIAIILARQHSKGIALKNLQKVGGISLLGRAIIGAIDSQVFSHVVVSSDGDDIIQEAQTYPDVITIKRPDELASDTASSIDGVIHALNNLGVNDGVCCLLQPTSPLRCAKHIQEAYQLFVQQQYQGSVVSTCQASMHPYKMLIADGDGYRPINALADLEALRQSLPSAFCPNGAIYFNDIATLRRHKRFFNEPLALYQMSYRHSLDIDTPEDLALANEYVSATR